MSLDLTVICPSRGRPKQARALWDSFMDTRSTERATLHFAMDDGDKSASDYPPTWRRHPSHSAVEALNFHAQLVKTTYISFVGDDNRFVSKGWDEAILDALDAMGGGVVYPNDLIIPGSLPSTVFMSTAIVKAVGWFALPSLKINYFDNVWQDLGNGVGRLRYLPDVAVQHLSLPHVFDDFAKSEAHEAQIVEDRRMYLKWTSGQRAIDVAKARAALGIEAAA